MKHRTAFAAAALTATSVILVAPSAHAAGPQYADANCISGPEWSALNVDRKFGDADHSARRAVIEQAFDVRPVAVTHDAVDPLDPASPPHGRSAYEASYRFCGSDDVFIVIAYRKTSDAWQWAGKGGLPQAAS